MTLQPNNNLHKKIDLYTVLTTSFTLVLFCGCAYWLLSQYSGIQQNIGVQTEKELVAIGQLVQRLESGESIDNQTLSNQLQASKNALQSRRNDWLILEQALSSLMTIMFILIISHLFFVHNYFKKKKAK